MYPSPDSREFQSIKEFQEMMGEIDILFLFISFVSHTAVFRAYS